MSRAFDPARAAAALHDRRTRHVPVGQLPADIAPRDEAEGVATQRRLAAIVGADRPPGFKIGATGRRMQEYLGLSGPAGGFMAASGLHASGASLRFADYVRPGLECELAVRLAQDLPAHDASGRPCSPEQALAAVGELMAAIELVDNRYGAMESLHMPTLLADQVFHAAAILGAPAPSGWQGWDLTTIPGKILVDGQERDSGLGGELLGHPMRALAWLAASPLAAAFGGLQAGQVVMLGSVCPPIWIDAPQINAPIQARVEFAGLAPVMFTLV